MLDLYIYSAISRVVRGNLLLSLNSPISETCCIAELLTWPTGTIVELSSNNESESCEVLVKFGDGTHAWAPAASLKLLSAPPADERAMCVVCKRREGGAAPVLACDLCGRGYHARCHAPPVDACVAGAAWHCRRCVDQRYRVAAAENRALRRRQQQDLTPPCDVGLVNAVLHYTLLLCFYNR